MSSEIEELVSYLKELQSAKYDSRANALRSYNLADRVLELIYDLIVEKTQITHEDRAVIGPLLENSLTYIKLSINRVALEYRRRLDTDVFRKRSALQFLIEYFGECPIDTPGKKLSELFPDIEELTRILDDLISTYKGRKDPEDPDSDRDEADHLPASHTWWKE